jgi:hypothetical protein
MLPPNAKKGHIFPHLRNHALLSVGILADHGCKIIFEREQARVLYNNQPIMLAQRTPQGLWAVPNPTPAVEDNPKPPTVRPSHTANIVTPTSTVADLVHYLHATCFSPTKTTLLKAIRNNHFTTWPGFTADNVTKHLTKTIETDMGHLDQQRKNLQSTQPTPPRISQSNPTDDFTATPTISDGTNTHQIFAGTVDIPPKTGHIYTDQTGAFPHYSASGHRYIMVLYDYDSNAILAEPLINKSATEHLRAYKAMLAILISRGLRPQLQRLDNEASNLLKHFITASGIDFQLAPPGIHRRNAAERAIRTFKNHFIAGLSSTDRHFPIFLWDQLLHQATLTLNLLRQSRINPKLSAYAQLHGQFDFNRTPLAPPGTRAVKHIKTDKRNSWAMHGELAWYVGPAMEHYRCYRLYNPRTQAYSIADTVSLHPSRVPLPRLSSADATRLAARDLVHTLQHPHPATPFLQLGDPDIQALRQLADIFDRSILSHPSAPGVTPATSSAPGVKPAEPNVTCPEARPVPRPGSQPTPPLVTHFADTPVQPERPATSPTLPAPSYNLRSRTPTTGHRHNLRQRSWTSNLHHALAALDPNFYQATPSVPLDTMFESPAIMTPAEFANAVTDPITGKQLEYRHLITDPTTKQVWLTSSANEFGRLAQGVGGRIKGTNTIFFINHHEVPQGQFCTYARFVCSERPQKAEVERTRLTVGGNLIDYPGSTSTPTSDITTFKCLANATLSDRDSRMCCADVKNFYLNTPMKKHEYMRIHISLIPPEIIEEYDLLPKVHNDFIYIRIEKGMYGLPQAGLLANQLLEKRLKPHGYFQCRHTPGLWKHTTRKTMFTLVVDDFGIKYSSPADANHLLNLLRADYEAVTVDWDASLYCGISLKWDYKRRTCDMSMPGYIPAALAKYQHPHPKRPQYAPHRYNTPQYGRHIQLPEPVDDSDLLPPPGVKRIQQITGTILYYGRAVDNTLLVALSDIASRQAKATSLTEQDTTRLLDYCATNPNATLRFHASDMILKGHSDASYLNASKARSRVGGHFYLGNLASKPECYNGAILNPVGILRHVASSAAEAEVGGLFVNLKEALVLRQTLHDMGYPQPTTPIQTDNSTAAGLANNTIKQNKSRHIDMRYHWIRDRGVVQGQFNIFWDSGSNNLADYFTKHHAPIHHRNVRPIYIHST